jgi:hypothetical protein
MTRAVRQWMWFAYRANDLRSRREGRVKRIGAADNPSLHMNCPDHLYSVCHGYPLDVGL